MNKAIKYRLYPNNSQIHLIESTFGCCRKIWNLMLSDKIEYYKENKANKENERAMLLINISEFINKLEDIKLKKLLKYLERI